MKNKNKKGFTLIELLVVIAIIGILAGIVIVSVGSSQRRAKKASLQATLASAVTTANLCLNDGASLNPVALNSTICDNPEIMDDLWPTLPPSLNGYSYSLSADEKQLFGSDGTSTIVTCTIETGSCQ